LNHFNWPLAFRGQILDLPHRGEDDAHGIVNPLVWPERNGLSRCTPGNFNPRAAEERFCINSSGGS
jgi:hypothetical protein